MLDWPSVSPWRTRTSVGFIAIDPAPSPSRQGACKGSASIAPLYPLPQLSGRGAFSRRARGDSVSGWRWRPAGGRRRLFLMPSEPATTRASLLKRIQHQTRQQLRVEVRRLLRHCRACVAYALDVADAWRVHQEGAVGAAFAHGIQRGVCVDGVLDVAALADFRRLEREDLVEHERMQDSNIKAAHFRGDIGHRAGDRIGVPETKQEKALEAAQRDRQRSP